MNLFVHVWELIWFTAAHVWEVVKASSLIYMRLLGFYVIAEGVLVGGIVTAIFTSTHSRKPVLVGIILVHITYKLWLLHQLHLLRLIIAAGITRPISNPHRAIPRLDKPLWLLRNIEELFITCLAHFILEWGIHLGGQRYSKVARGRCWAAVLLTNL